MIDTMVSLRRLDTFGGRLRLAHVIARGYEMLTTDDTAAANVWWREYARVWCNDNNIIEVRLG